MFKKLSSRKFKMGAYAAVVSVILVLVIIALNILSVLLTARANAFIDLTADNAFKVSDEIMDIFRGIKTPMEITVLYDEENFETMNPYCAQVEHILSEAEKCNDNLRVRYVDPVQNPEIGSVYPALDCTQCDIIFENLGTGRANELDFSDLFFISNNSITGSKAEAVIASKLVSMTSGKTFAVSFTSGHGESTLDTFRDLLELNNYTVGSVGTLTEDIPDDTLCLIIAGPSVDFSTDEIRKLERFLINDGEYGKSILFFSSMDNLDLPNLEGFLANYGLGIGDEIVAEMNAAYVYGDKQSYALSGYMEEEYAANALKSGLLSISPYTRPVEALFTSSEDVRLTGLMCFSNTAIAVNPLDPGNPRSGADETLYSAIVADYYKYVTGVGELSSKVCVFGSIYFADDTMLSTESLGNAEYLVGVMSKLAPNEISIDVASKSILGGYMTITAQAAKWLGIVFIGLVPAVVLACGAYVYIRRRNR